MSQDVCLFNQTVIFPSYLNTGLKDSKITEYLMSKKQNVRKDTIIFNFDLLGALGFILRPSGVGPNHWCKCWKVCKGTFRQTLALQ